MKLKINIYIYLCILYIHIMSDYIIKYAGIGISNILSNISHHSDDTHIELLDPISTMLKLCILKYKYTRQRIITRMSTIN